MRTTIIAVAACLFLGQWPLSAIGQEEDSLKIHNLKAIEIKGAAMSANPAAGTLDHAYMGKETLLRYAANTFVNTLERMPGMSAINTGVGIAKPVIRGMSLNRVIVNEYGIKQEGQQWGLDHGLEIDPFSVDRVEVIKGPVSVLYGSDGIGGVINILQPIIPVEDTQSIDVIASYKSNNDLWGGSARWTNVKGGRYTVLRATYQNYASYRVPADSFTYNGYILPIYGQRLKNTGGRELDLSLLQGWRKPWGHTQFYISNYYQNAGFFVGAFGVPRAYQMNVEGSDRAIGLPRQTIDHFKAINNTTVLLAAGKLDFDFGYQYNRRQELSLPHAHGQGPAPTGDLALGLGLHTATAQAKWSLRPESRPWTNTMGIALQQQWNQRSGYEFLIPAFTSTQAGIYDFYERVLAEGWLLSAGLRADWGRQVAPASYVDVYDSSGTLTGTSQRSPEIDKNYLNLSGSLGMAWSFMESGKIKLNAGTAYRMPSLAELTANGVHHGTFRHEMGNAGLGAERGFMADAGFYYEHSEKAGFSFSPFANYFTNYIFLNPTARFSPLPDAGQIYQYTGARAWFTGFELNAHAHLAPWMDYSVGLEYVWNLNADNSRPLPFTPPFSWANELTIKPSLPFSWTKDLYLIFSGHYFAAQNRVAQNEPVTGGYFLVDASLSQSFVWGKQKMGLYLNLKNIGNVRYLNNMSRYRILNLPEQGFNAQVMLRWQL